MATINSELFDKLKKGLNLSQPRIYSLINEKVRQTHLPRNLAAIVLASENGLNISKYATEEDLAIIRNTAQNLAPPPVIVPNGNKAKSAPKGKKTKSKTKKVKMDRRGNSVFVVHGRNENARKAVFEFLRSLGLKPLEWSQIIKKSKLSSPYIGDILETAFREAAAVVVLFTPDDDARLKKIFQKKSDPPFEKKLSGQSRPNVLFEAGMAFGRNPNSTVLVQLGSIRTFSDIAGRHIVHLSNQPTSRNEFATKLANAGCNVDTSGNDWLNTGDFKL